MAQLPNEQQAVIHRDRAERMVAEGRIQDAVRELAIGLRHDTREPGSWQLLGEIYGAAGFHEPAASYLQKSLREDYTNLSAWVSLANVYAQIGGPYMDLAFEQLEMAFGFDANNADLHYIKGSIYAQKGELDKARESMKSALAANPSHPYAKHDLDALSR